MTPETPGPFVSPTPQCVPGEAPERQIADADLTLPHHILMQVPLPPHARKILK